MGIYVNPNHNDFREAVCKEIYVDKSMLIDKLYRFATSRNKYICISRPRRFGKSTDANMLSAYFSKGCDSHILFNGLKISETEMYEEHINKHNVIHLNIQNFLSKSNSIENLIQLISLRVIRDLKKEFHNIDYFDDSNFSFSLQDIYEQTKQQFIFIIDEWDCIFREYKEDERSQRKYLDFLRDLLKDQSYVELCYMTGILPIKKYGTHSDLNMFDEISMIEQRGYSNFMGFTQYEVQDLCKEYALDYTLMQEWYDGYKLEGGISVYSPRSVVAAIQDRKFSNYWSQTENYEALKTYIDLNFDGLKDTVVSLLTGQRKKVDTLSFQNDMTSFHSKDDVLTLLIHLGYLGYENECVYIPNNEVKDTFITSIKNSNWDVVTRLFQQSNALLEATWNMEADKVAQYIQDSHYETSILQYNDENALS
ncbi:MAG: AAA family ATPase [Erysipelotrichaceae bacterium]|uniref:AAA family ATPase n=1 Tax=Floccifex sp. TaxID=2815810 RepID=UPI002A760C9E|nr:AAA family ATPase [Floccifex sp.]MDD7280374.1 AAA family ATPase [Erysipelotrichaceae bacterium]MDY2957893.1 AAA family ATPase [Floccifex sp.]